VRYIVKFEGTSDIDSIFIVIMAPDSKMAITKAWAKIRCAGAVEYTKEKKK
jgi:hypothetical protein